jgi:hypothetical protein
LTFRPSIAVPSQNFIRLKKLNDSWRLETIIHPRWHTPFLGGAELPQVARPKICWLNLLP